MGAYFLSFFESKEYDINAFKERKQKISYHYNQDNFYLTKYNKSLLLNDPWHYEDDKHVIIANGTFCYRGLGTVDSFNSIIADIINDNSLGDVYGHFSIVHYVKSKSFVKIYFDEAGYGAPYVLNNEIISSSFLACCEASNGLSLNKEAIFEQIYTGCYFNDESTFNEVRRITSTSSLLFDKFEIQFVQLKYRLKKENFSNSNSALKNQNTTILNYLENWRRQINEHSLDLGLSSGYDSRLLLAAVEKLNFPYQVHSYWKPKLDFDNEVAIELSSVVDKTLIRVPLSNSKTIDLNSLIKRAFWYYDGLFPANHGWVREYRTIEHRSKILGAVKFGFSGICGEQYRNEYQLFNKKYTLRSVMRNMMLEGDNYEILINSDYRDTGISRLEKTLKKGFALKKDKNKLIRLDIQRFYCEMWVKGGPGIRNQIENQLTYFLSPFTDRYLQKSSYQILPYIKYGGSFQAHMITDLNYSLASVKSDYGFSFNNLSVKHYLSTIVGGILGLYTKRKLLNRFLHSRGKNNSDAFGENKKLIVEKLRYLRNYKFPFPIEHSKFNSDTLDRLVALSTLLEHFESKIYDKTF
jgi:hypothetical protein